MSSRWILLALALAGCAEDPAIVINVDAHALTTVELAPPSTLTNELQGAGSYRWSVVETPPGSIPHPIEGETPFASMMLDIRGTYLVERWYVLGLGENLTHRFVIRALGARPIASSTTTSHDVSVQTAVTIDGAASWSPENLSLVHEWRLASRPLGSAATLTEGGVHAQLVPDVVGDYVIELNVFDGELWSAAPAVLSISAN